MGLFEFDLEARVERSELIPTRANATDAGLDLRSKETVHLAPNQRVLIGTGVQVKIPPGFVGLLALRSSTSKRHITLINSVGIIDSDYRGELLLSVKYTGDDALGITISRDERIAQLLIVPIALPQVLLRYVDEETWNNTERGTGGFGSTGT